MHRQRDPKPTAAPGPMKEFHHPAELPAAEKEHVLEVLDSPRLADKAVAQAYTILLDEGCYLGCQTTMHRLLRERGQSGERRAHAVQPARKKPELRATGPVWLHPGRRACHSSAWSLRFGRLRESASCGPCMRAGRFFS